MKKRKNNKLLLFMLAAIVIVAGALLIFINKGGVESAQVDSIGDSVADTVRVEEQEDCADSVEAAFAIIDKQAMTLQLYGIKGEKLMEVGVACGKNYGNKQCPGDMRTPEGVFKIEVIQDASGWTHDFKDGKGEIKGAYGHWFMRLRCPGHSGIGIHGTHDPSSIGKRCTEGCIRLSNDKLEKFKQKAYPGMVVVILPSNRDVAVNDSLQKVKTR